MGDKVPAESIIETSYRLGKWMVQQDDTFDTNTVLEIIDETRIATADEIQARGGVEGEFDAFQASGKQFSVKGVTQKLPDDGPATTPVHTAIKLYRGADADTLVEEWYHRQWFLMPEEQRQLFKDFHNTTGDTRPDFEAFAQDGRDFFFSERLHEQAGEGVLGLFRKAKNSLARLVGRIRQIRKSQIPKEIEDIWTRAGKPGSEFVPKPRAKRAPGVRLQQGDFFTRSDHLQGLKEELQSLPKKEVIQQAKARGIAIGKQRKGQLIDSLLADESSRFDEGQIAQGELRVPEAGLQKINETLLREDDATAAFQIGENEFEFVKTEDGEVDFGQISPEIGRAINRQSGVIRLETGNENFGLNHIEKRADEISKLSGKSAPEFVRDVARDFDFIYPGNKGNLQLVKENKPNELIVIGLKPSEDGNFYTVVTARLSRRDEFKNKEPLWGRAQSNQPNEGPPGAFSGQSGSKRNIPPETDESNTAFQIRSSDADIKQAEKNVIDQFGTTQNIRAAGFILPDGRLVNFAGKSDGDTRPPIKKHIDVVEQVHPTLSGFAARDDLIQNGGWIRLASNVGAIEMANKPTAQQLSQIKRFIEDTKELRGDSGYSLDLFTGPGQGFFESFVNADDVIPTIEQTFSGFKRESRSLVRQFRGGEVVFQISEAINQAKGRVDSGSQIADIEISGKKMPGWVWKRVGHIIPNISAFAPKFVDKPLEVMEKLINTPFYLAKNQQGEATTFSVDLQAQRQTQSLLFQGIGSIRDNFVRYRSRLAGQETPQEATPGRLVRIGVGDIFRRGEGGPLKSHEFSRAVWHEWGNPGATGIPEVRQAAENIRRIFDDVGKELVEQGQLSKELKSAIEQTLGHRPRVWSQWAIQKYGGTLRKIIRQKIEQGRIELPEGADIEESLNAIMDSSMGYTWLDVNDEGVSDAAFLKGRLFDFIDDEDLVNVEVQPGVFVDFVETDPEVLMRAYFRSVIPDLWLTRVFGSLDMKQQLDEIRASYTERLRDETEDALREEINKEMSQVLKEVKNFRDLVRGKFAPPRDPHSFWNRAGSTLLKFNTIAYLGGVSLSQIPDLARPLMRYGMEPFKDAMLAWATMPKKFKENTKWLGEIGAVTDLVTSQRILEFAQLTDLKSGKSRIERAVDFAADQFGFIALIDQMNAYSKSMAGLAVSQYIMKAALRSGNLTEAELKQLAQMGLNADDLAVIADQFKKHGETVNDALHLPNAREWDNLEIKTKMENAIFKEIQTTIVTPQTGDLPFLASTPLGRLALQFKSFAFASLPKVVVAGMQQRDAKLYAGMMASVFLGGVAYSAKQLARGRDLTEDPDEFLLEAIDNSGLLSIGSDINAMLEQLSAGHVGLNPLVSDEGVMSRFRNQSVADVTLGPTAGTLQRSMSFVSGMADTVFTGELDSSTVQDFFRLMPYSRLWYMRRFLFDPVRQGTIDRFVETEEAI